MQKDNATQTLINLVEALKIPVTRKTLTEELERHPNSNSLAAFKDILDRVKVPNGAFSVDFQQLSQLPVPYVAHLSEKGFGVITHSQNGAVTISNENWQGKTFTMDEFESMYSGTVLLAEKDEQSGEPGYPLKRRKEKISEMRLPVAIGAAIFLLIVYLAFQPSFYPSLNWRIASLILVNCAGLFTTILLLIQSMDANNPFVQKLCVGGNKNCNHILSSKAAKVFDGLSWSEVGFFYFAASLIVLLFNSGNVRLIQSLAILNIMALPYTFYSVFYQWRIAKQWCVFCCVIQGLLWGQFFAFLPFLQQPIQVPSVFEGVKFLSALVLPVLCWVALKPYLNQGKQLTLAKRQLRNFKYNTDLFNAILRSGHQFELPSESSSLIIGNPEAKKIVTVVASPYCQPCAKAHQALEWIEERNDIKLQMIFATSANGDDNNKLVATHLLSLAGQPEQKTLKQAVHDWFDQKQKNYLNWAQNYPVESKSTVLAQLEEQRNWCTMAGVRGTPTIFINGRKLPSNYQTEDIRYFI